VRLTIYRLTVCRAGDCSCACICRHVHCSQFYWQECTTALLVTHDIIKIVIHQNTGMVVRSFSGTAHNRLISTCNEGIPKYTDYKHTDTA